MSVGYIKVTAVVCCLVALATVYWICCHGSEEKVIAIYNFQCAGEIKLTELSHRKDIYKMTIRIEPDLNRGEVLMKFSDGGRVYLHTIKFGNAIVEKKFDWYSTDCYISYEPLSEGIEGEATISLQLHP